MLSTSPSQEVRLYVAGNPSTPPSALQHLAHDPEERVREAVAQNPNTPAQTLQMASNYIPGPADFGLSFHAPQAMSDTPTSAPAPASEASWETHVPLEQPLALPQRNRPIWLAWFYKLLGL